jgi:ubiquinone/menaquinone biosynthesis C-methylase UbiE
MTNDLPQIQDYRTLAADYDAKRYEGQVNLLKENFRRTALLDLLPRSPRRALDVACGTGRGVGMLTSVARAAFGIDGTIEMLQVALGKLSRETGFGGLSRGDAARLPFADGTFDAVTCLNFVHLFPDLRDKQAFVTEIARVLKPGGITIVEFENAMLGGVLGFTRKYFGYDIGYDWPWTIKASFPKDLLTIEEIRGTNFPGVWRVPMLRWVERLGKVAGLNHLASRTLVRARRN